jgi:thymidylate synthase
MNPDEIQYIALVDDIISNGELVTEGRTRESYRQVFGRMLRFDLSNNVIPLLTTKRVFWKGAVHELLWFLKGSTDASELSAQGVHIWDGNTSQAFLDQYKLNHLEVGDVGPLYGFQWRHFGAPYTGMKTNYDDQGVDQLANILDLLKTDPYSRRIMLTSYDPASVHLAVLPPCHVLAVFSVSPVSNALSCHLTMRSCDVGLGLPFNIASYALLTHLLATLTNRPAGELVISLANAHIYTPHVQPLKAQILREPRAFPRVRLDIDGKAFEEIQERDIVLEGYTPHGPVKMDMAL